MRDYFEKENLKELIKEKKVLRWLAGFMALMLLCTIISRAIYADSMPQVSTGTVSNMCISHDVEKEGEVVKLKERAINLTAGIHVEDVYVKTGQIVEANAPILQLSMTDIQDSIKSQQLEIQKIAAQMQVLEYNQQLSEEEKLLKQQRAQEDYNAKKYETDKDVAVKKQDYQDAQNSNKGLISREDYINSAIGSDEEINRLTQSLSGNDINYTNNIQGMINARKQVIAASAGVEWDSLHGIPASKERTEALEYDSAVDSQKNDLTKAQREIDDANKAEEASSAYAVLVIDKQEKEDTLVDYLELEKANGTIYCEKAATITEVQVKIGDLTTESAAVRLSDMDESLQFQASVTKDEQKNLAVSDSVNLSFDLGKKKIDATIDSIIEDPNTPGNYLVSMEIPVEDMFIGKTGTMTVSKQSERCPACVPLEALHVENAQYYVLVIKSSETILGEELVASRVDVTILDKNDKYAAVNASAFTGEEKLIISSTKDLSDGIRVRLREE